MSDSKVKYSKDISSTSDKMTMMLLTGFFGFYPSDL